MSTKKKLILIISVLVLTILCSVVTIVSVFAAQSASISSGVNVVYVVPKDLKGSVEAWYRLGGKAEMWYDPIVESLGTRTFDEETTSLTNLSKLSVLDLTNHYNCIRFEFTFTNSNETSAYVAKLTPPTIYNNLTIAYTVPDETGVAEKISDTEFKLFAQQTATYKITYTISDIYSTAELSGNFVWTLTSC